MSYWDWTKGMQHHQTYDEVFLYLPTDPHDILDLGGEMVAYLADEEYAFTEPTAVYVPGGVLPQSQLLQARGPALLHARSCADRQRQVPRG